MYAHQVIEGLKFLCERGNENINKPMVAESIRLIENAQRFHIGELLEFFEIFYNDLGVVKYDLSPKFDPPPYQKTWIDFTYNNLKHGMLVVSYKPKVFIIPFMTLEDGMWSPEFHMGRFTLDEENSFVLKETRLLHGDFKQDIIKDQNMRSALTGLVYTLFCKLLSCKNIDTIDNEPPPRLNKSRKKKGKCPIFTYKTLVIKPTSKKQQEQEAQGLWNNRVHLCRGHFKEYSSDKPLFGKYTGRYWWQPSVRGRNTDGVVMKDYEVKAE